MNYITTYCRITTQGFSVNSEDNHLETDTLSSTLIAIYRKIISKFMTKGEKIKK